ncbi:TonB-dependent receptor domain-containing protein [Nitrospirillum sp. BR 11163]|uniref:TonB-dependent receptor domain-containing protein n=1 Tax=Nitrospirillum sp. BR 11163 TaxID=3104323 RepID=UPI003A4C5400
MEYKPEEGSLYYARAAKGFRLGAPNQPLPSTCAADLAAIGLTRAPSSVNSDSLWSYEAGVKRTLAGGSASLNASAFYIDWTDIQTGFLLPNCGFSFASNAGDARSRGLEMDFSWRVTKSLTLNTSGSFTDATLQSDSPPSTGIGGKKGDRLPGIPRWSVQGGAQYDFPVVDRSAFARVDVRYISGYLNRFPGASTEAQPAGNFTVVDARIGMDVSSGLQAEIFATNIFNTKQLLEVDTELPDQRQILGRPRTVGITLRYDY